MNHFIIIFAAVLVVVAHCAVNKVVVPVAAEKLPLFNEKMTECEAETKITTTFQVMLKKKLNGEPINEDDFKNSLYCTASKVSIIDEHGHIVVDEVLEYFPSSVDKDAIRTMLEDCNNKFSVTDPKDMFMSIYGCYFTTGPVLLTLPSV